MILKIYSSSIFGEVTR